MAFDIYSTHTMLMAMKEIKPFSGFLQNRYFPTNDSTDIFSTDDVLMDIADGDNRLAPFVAPRKGGVTILREGYTTERYTPPFIAPKRPMTVDDLKRRGFGEALYSQLTPEERQGALMMQDLDELSKMIGRRIEAMAAETLATNGCIMKHIADDTGKYEEKKIQFYSGGSNPAQYTPSTRWDQSGADIIGDIAAVAEIMAASSLPATELIVAPDVGTVILNDPTIKSMLDIRNYNVGGVDPEQLPDGCTKIARLNCKGHVIDVLQYSEKYTNDSGVSTGYIPAKKAILTAPGCGRTLYGAVTQMEQSDNQFHTYAERRVPKYVADAAHNTREIYVTSCPLLIPKNKNAWYVINAIA